MLREQFSLCDKTHFLIIKGISIFIIVLVHLCNRYLDFPYLSPIAGAAVAVFLLCSGYGLSESWKRKNGLQGFWSNKIIKIWIPSFLKLAFFAIITCSGIYAWVTEYPLFLYGWYLQVLFGEYLVFWLVFRFVKTKQLRLGILFAASIIAFLLVDSQLYAEQMLSFPIGVAFSQLEFKDKISNWATWKKTLLITGFMAIAVGAFLLRNRCQGYLLFNLVWLIFKLNVAIIISLLPWMLQKIPFSVFIPLGSLSYMLYLINNDILALLEGRVIWYTVILALVLLIVCAVVFKKLCDKIEELYLNKKRRK